MVKYSGGFVDGLQHGQSAETWPNGARKYDEGLESVCIMERVHSDGLTKSDMMASL